jgi:hypothetical protein
MRDKLKNIDDFGDLDDQLETSLWYDLSDLFYDQLNIEVDIEFSDVIWDTLKI